MSAMPPPHSEDDPSGIAPPPRPEPQSREPLFNSFPGVVLVLGAVMLGVQIADSMAAGQGGLAHGLIYWAGTLRTGATAEAFPPAPGFGLSPYVLHVFVHFGWAHLLINLGALAAFGAVSRAPFGPGLRGDMGFLAFFFACAVGGAVLHQLTHMNAPSMMAGSSTAISGLLAAAGWMRGGRAGMLRLAVPWFLINLAIALAGLVFPVPLAWAGHVGGLLVGMAAYPVFVRYLRVRPDV
ncbi:MAG: hypothetical protein CMH90_02170 [Oceanicaulis sp.]|uniref:rhomboid family intramembrane serine protease n=1 Tax=Oceanicaulis sp. UBA2681 TaxID=1947007 RepID=UPI000C0B2D21|nr:rhomboid family intramembrane serine protease [Oceanicaulis sp. UBA2681]MAP48264.1 hypothetical protein [Oceanicaulis sp.]